MKYSAYPKGKGREPFDFNPKTLSHECVRSYLKNCKEGTEIPDIIYEHHDFIKIWFSIVNYKYHIKVIELMEYVFSTGECNYTLGKNEFYMEISVLFICLL